MVQDKARQRLLCISICGPAVCKKRQPRPSPSIGRGGITLKGITWEPLRDDIALTLWWQASQPVEKDYTIFIHLLDEDGNLVYGYDEPPCRNACPTTTWRPDEIIRDEHLIRPELPPGNYSLEIGLYDADVQRLPLQGGGDAFVIPLAEVTQ